MDDQRRNNTLPSFSKSMMWLNSDSNSKCFNILVAKETVPYFAGNFKDLPSFLAIVELLTESLPMEDHFALITYIYNFKLSPEVRLAVSIPNIPGDFEDLKNRLRRRYKDFKTKDYLDKLVEQFNSLSQGNMSVLEYREEILRIHDQIAFERIKNVESEQIQQTLLNDLHDEVLEKFKFGVNMRFNDELENCITLDEAVETVLNLENTGEATNINISDEDRALIRAGFVQIDIKNESKNSPNISLESHKTTSPKSEAGNISADEYSTTRLFGARNYISLKCKNGKGIEPLKFFIHKTSPNSVIRFSKVSACEIDFCKKTIRSPWCLGMEEVRSIGTITLVMILAHGVNLKFEFYVVEDNNFQFSTDALIGLDFMDTHVHCAYSKMNEISIKHRDSIYTFPIMK